MHLKSIATLEYPKILERLARETSFSASRALALSLGPRVDRDGVHQLLRMTAEAVRLLDTRPDFGIRSARDVRPHCDGAVHGVVLSASELCDISATLRAAEYVSKTARKLGDGFPLLGHLLRDMPVRQHLSAHIAESISEDGDVLDSASPELRRLRAEIRGAQIRLQERLHSLVGEFRAALQEPIVTMRSDRYVLPVRSDARSQVRGIVHDQSGSGATVFIEPLVVVE